MSKIDWTTAQPIFERIFKNTQTETELDKKLKRKSPEYNKVLEKNMRKYAEAEKIDLMQYGTPTIIEFNRLFEIYLKDKLEK
jgi:hypothetical protein